MNSNCLAGIFPILATTFTDDGALDLESQGNLIEYLLRQGAHGLGLFGNASEGYALTESERRQLLRLIVKQVNGRVPLVVSTGHTGTDDNDVVHVFSPVSRHPTPCRNDRKQHLRLSRITSSNL